MRAAAIFGLGSSPDNLKPFQDAESQKNAWGIGMPAASNQADAILLFGGDGTIHHHLSELVKLGVPVLIVPTGSGNDFARALGLRSVRDSLAAWRLYCAGKNPDKNNVRTIDLGVITPLEFADPPSTAPQASSQPDNLARESTLVPHYFCSVAGVGLDAEIARRANHLPRWLRGNGGYALTFAPTIFQFAPFPMKILTPSATPAHETEWTITKSQPTLLAAFANTPTYGGGMKIAPRAQMDDGLLDVCVIGRVDPLKLLCMFPTVYFGRHLNIREVDYFPASHLRIETDHPLDLYADGEYVCHTPVEISVQRAALRVIVHPSRATS